MSSAILMSFLRRTIAIVVSVSLILTAPGLDAYRSFAQANARPSAGSSVVPQLPASASSAVRQNYQTAPVQDVGAFSWLSLGLEFFRPGFTSTGFQAQVSQKPAPVPVGNQVESQTLQEVLASAPEALKDSGSAWTLGERILARLRGEKASSLSPAVKAVPFSVVEIIRSKGFFKAAPEKEVPAPEKVGVQASSDKASVLSPVSSPRSSFLKAAFLSLAVVAVLAVPGFAETASASVQTPPSVSGLGAALSQAGSILAKAGFWGGNVLALVQMLPQFKELFKFKKSEGYSNHGLGWSVLGSVMLGLNAAANLAQTWFWGVQNTYRAIQSGVYYGLKKVFAYEPSEASYKPLSAEAPKSVRGLHWLFYSPWGQSLLINAAILGASYGIFFAAAPLVSPWLATPVGQGLIVFNQAVAGFIISLEAILTARRIAKTKDTSGINMGRFIMLMALRLGFLFWAAHGIYHPPANLPSWMFVVYAVQNGIGILASLVTLQVIRKYSPEQFQIKASQWKPVRLGLRLFRELDIFSSSPSSQPDQPLTRLPYQSLEKDRAVQILQEKISAAQKSAPIRIPVQQAAGEFGWMPAEQVLEQVQKGRMQVYVNSENASQIFATPYDPELPPGSVSKTVFSEDEGGIEAELLPILQGNWKHAGKTWKVRELHRQTYSDTFTKTWEAVEAIYDQGRTVREIFDKSQVVSQEWKQPGASPWARHVKKGMSSRLIYGMERARNPLSLEWALEAWDGFLTLIRKIPGIDFNGRGIEHDKIWLVLLENEETGETLKVLAMGSANNSWSALSSQPANYENVQIFIIPGDAPSGNKYDLYKERFERLWEKSKETDQTIPPKPPRGLENPDPAPEEPRVLGDSASQKAQTSASSREVSIYEDFYGIRHLADPYGSDLLPPLADDAGTRTILKYIRNLGISQETIEKIAERKSWRTHDDTHRAEWRNYYDSLSRINKERGQLSEAHKYKVPSSQVKRVYPSGKLFGLFPVGAWLKSLDETLQKAGIVSLHRKLLFGLPHFTYELMETLFGNYHRVAWFFEYKYSTVNFLNKPLPGEKIAPPASVINEMAFQLAMAQAPLTSWQKLNTRPNFIKFNRFWTVFAVPSFQFMTRRGTMAVAAAVASGFLGSLSVLPALAPVMKLSLTAIGHTDPAGMLVSLMIGMLLARYGVRKIREAYRPPKNQQEVRAEGRVEKIAKAVLPIVFGLMIAGIGLGPAIVLTSKALVILAHSVPFFGAALGIVTKKVVHALLEDLIVDRLLNTAILSTILTLPRLAEQRYLMGVHSKEPDYYNNPIGGRLKALGSVLASGEFLKANLRTMAGLVMVGAEIEGVMAFGDKIDGFFDPAYQIAAPQSLKDHFPHFKLFQTAGAAMERPAQWKDEHGNLQQNAVPFGGAITWGHVLLDRAQDMIGFNLSEWTLRFSNRLIYSWFPNAATAAFIDTDSLPQVTGMFVANAASNNLVSDTKLLGQKGNNWVSDTQLLDLDRMALEIARAGNMKEAMAQSRFQMEALRSDIQETAEREKAIRKGLKPIDPKELEKYRKERGDLDRQVAELERLDKLAQNADLSASGGPDREKNIKEFMAKYSPAGALLGKDLNQEASSSRSRYLDGLGFEAAKLAQAAESLEAALRPAESLPSADRKSNPNAPQIEELEKIAAEMKKSSQEIQNALAAREQSAESLARLKRIRDESLKAFRDSQGMADFDVSRAKSAMTMELTYGLNIINEAQKILKDALSLVEQKRTKVNSFMKGNSESLKAAERLKGMLEGWRKEAEQKAVDKEKDAEELKGDLNKANEALKELSLFTSEVTRLLSDIDSRDSKSSPSALAEYKRKLNLMPDLFRQKKEGYPDDPDKLSEKWRLDKVEEAKDGLKKITDGIEDLNKAPSETGGFLLFLHPGAPKDEDKVTNRFPATGQEAVAILKSYKAAWQRELNERKDDLKKTREQLGEVPADSETEEDDFGDSTPVNKKLYLQQQQSRAREFEANVRTRARDLDRWAQEINDIAKSNLPLLSGKTYDEMKDILSNYQDELDKVQTPDADKDKDGNFRVSMNKLRIGRTLIRMGDDLIEWILADKTSEALVTVVNNTLPRAKDNAQALVDMHQAVIDNLDGKIQFIEDKIKKGEKPAPNKQESQQIIDESLAVLVKFKGVLENTINFLEDKNEGGMAALVQDSIDSVNPDPNKTDGLAELYRKRIELYEKAEKALKQDLSWGLATGGAEEGNVSEAVENIENEKKKVREDLLAEVQDSKKEIEDRLSNEQKLPPEEVYGRLMPYELPVRVRHFQAEKDRRAPVINQVTVQIKDLMSKIDSLSGGRYRMMEEFGSRLPVNIDPRNPASAEALKSLAEKNGAPRSFFERMGDRLEEVADQEEARGDSIPENKEDREGAPVGEKNETPVLNEAKQAALRILELSGFLVPTDPSRNSYFDNVVEFLYADGVVDGVLESMGRETSDGPVVNPEARIPRNLDFLSRAESTLNSVLANWDLNKNYVEQRKLLEASGDLAALRRLDQEALDRNIRIIEVQRDLAQEGVGVLLREAGEDRDVDFDGIHDYYDARATLAESGNDSLDGEIKKIDKYKAELEKQIAENERQRTQLKNWLAQINPYNESALKQMSYGLDKIDNEMHQMLNDNYLHDLTKKQYRETSEHLEVLIGKYSEKRKILLEKLKGLKAADLNPRLYNDVKQVLGPQAAGAWTIKDPKDERGSLVVVEKGRLEGLLERLLSPHLPDRDLSPVIQYILNSPQRLMEFMPDSKLIRFGDDKDGFYLLYHTEFGTYKGLTTHSRVKMGNVARVLGNNISLGAFSILSGSPEKSGEGEGLYMAPFGDRGIRVEVETIKENKANVFSATLHRFIQDIPKDLSRAAQTEDLRLMVYDKFAWMWVRDEKNPEEGKFYFSASGFKDMAIYNKVRDDSGNEIKKPEYYGGDVRTRFQFNEVASVKASQVALIAHDPRWYRGLVNLDVLANDPDLNHDFIIAASGAHKEYWKTQLGTSLNLDKLLGNREPFVMDFFTASQRGTDDSTQKSLGTTVLKGFSIPFISGAKGTIRGGVELGQKVNSYTSSLKFHFPKQAFSIEANGRLIGGKKALEGTVSKKISDSTQASLGFGAPYIGMNNQIKISLDTSFTLGELWRKVTRDVQKAYHGGELLKDFHSSLTQWESAGRSQTQAQAAKELASLYDEDVVRRVLTQKAGRLAENFEKLQRAGVFWENTRVHAFIGYVSQAVSNDSSDRALGGGPQVGVYNVFKLDAHEREQVLKTSVEIYKTGVEIQKTLMERTLLWQKSVLSILKAQWEMEMAEYTEKNAQGDSLLIAQAGAQKSRAKKDLSLALTRYNSMAGRSLTDSLPFQNVGIENFAAFEKELNERLSLPEGLTGIFKGLNPAELNLPVERFNLMKLPGLRYLDQLRFSIGAQIPDLMASQPLGIGAGLTLPIYHRQEVREKEALKLESQAELQEILDIQKDYALEARKASLELKALKIKEADLRQKLPKAAEELSRAMAAYRNGQISSEKLREAFESWQGAASQYLEVRASSVLAQSKSEIYRGQAPKSKDIPARRTGAGKRQSDSIPSPESPVTNHDLDEAFRSGLEKSHLMKSLQARSEAARAREIGARSRISKVSLDADYGVNMIPSGTGWIPGFLVTGYGMGLWPLITFVSVEFSPSELRDVAVGVQKSDVVYHQRLLEKMKTQMALDLYQSYKGYLTAKENHRIYREAQMSREAEEALRDQKQAQAALNHILGRGLESEVGLKASAREADGWIEGILKKVDSAALEESIRQNRLERIKYIQKAVDNNLKKQKVKTEPITLFARSLGGLFKAWSEEPTAARDDVEQAKQERIAAERSLESFKSELSLDRLKVEHRIAEIEKELAGLGGRADPSSRASRNRLQAELDLRKAELLRLGSGSLEKDFQAAPQSFQELKSRLAKSEIVRMKDLGYEAMGISGNREEIPLRLSAKYRFFRARNGLDGAPIGQDFFESWAELRTLPLPQYLSKSFDSPKTLAEISRLQQQYADALDRASIAEAASRAESLLAEFEANVQLYHLSGKFADAGLRVDIYEKIKIQAKEIVSRLHLDPRTKTEELIRLIPPAGGDISQVVRRYTEQTRIGALRAYDRIVLDLGLMPDAASGARLQIDKIKAEEIAKKMSYKGFDLVIAYGLFRGRNIFAAGFEAPDFREVEDTLTSILGDSLKAGAEAKERQKNLALNIHALLVSVEEGARLAEAYHKVLQRAQEKAGAVPPGDLRQALAARQEAARALENLIETLAALRKDFVALATVLKSLGIDIPTDSSKEGVFSAGFSLEGDHPAEKVLRSYFSGRLGDPDFFKSQKNLPSSVQKLVLEYQQALKDDRVVRLMELPGAKKLELILRIDAEGRRVRLEHALGLMPKDRQLEMFKSLKADIEGQKKSLAERTEKELALYGSIRDSYWYSFARDMRKDPDSWKFEGATQRLSSLWLKKEAARQGVVEKSRQGLSSPQDFLARNKNLDDYLQAQRLYDNEVLNVFEEAQKALDPRWARALDSLFDFQQTYQRQKARLAYGRGITAADVLVEIAQSRLDSLRYEGAGEAALEKARQELKTYQALREAIAQRRIQLPSEEDGLDQAKENLGVRREDLAQNRRIQELGRSLAGSGFGLLDSQGRLERRAALEEIKKWREEGRVLYFDPKGLAVSPWTAPFKDPKEVEVYVYLGALALSKEAMSSLAKLKDASGKDLYKLEIAGSGAQALSTEAGLKALELKRKKYIALKLYSHGFAVDEKGNLKAVYLTSKDLDQAVQGLKQAGKSTLDEVDRALKRAQDEFKEAEERHNPLKEQRDQTLAELGKFHQQTLQAEAKQPKSLSEKERLRLETDKAKLELKIAEARKTVQKAKEKMQPYQSRLEEVLQAGDAESPELEPARKKLSKARAVLEKESEQLNTYEETLRTVSARLGEAQKARPAEASNPAKAKISKEEKRLRKDLERLDSKLQKAAQALEKAGKKLEFSKLSSKKAQANLENSKNWSLFKSDSVSWNLNDKKELVRVAAKPVYGNKQLDVVLENSSLSNDQSLITNHLPVISGPVLAVELDGEGRLVEVFTSSWKLKKAVRGFKLVDMEDREFSNAGGPLNPNFRFWKYVDPKTGNSVWLKGQYTVDKLNSAKRSVAANRWWPFAPQNWPDIALEIPRSIAKTPLEVAVGINPEEQGYKGEAYARKGEAAVKSRGIGAVVLDALDPLDLNKVGRVHDPSQLPNPVQRPALYPGEHFPVVLKTPGQKIILGKEHRERRVNQDQEDMENLPKLIWRLLEGGMVERVNAVKRGRGGSYPDSSWEAAVEWEENASGDNEKDLRAVKKSVEDAFQGTFQEPYKSVLEASPEQFDVDKVVQIIEYTPGAKDYEKQSEIYKSYGVSLEQRAREARKAAEALEREAGRAQARLKNEEQKRRELQSQVLSREQAVKAMGWKVAEEESKEYALKASQERLNHLKAELEQEEAWYQALRRNQNPVFDRFVRWTLSHRFLFFAALVAVNYMILSIPAVNGWTSRLIAKIRSWFKSKPKP